MARREGYWKERSAKRRESAAYREQQSEWYRSWYERNKDDPARKAKAAERMRAYSQDPALRPHHVARWLVHRRLETGALVRQACEVCGSENTEAHHEDYAKPLQVCWLCKKHHREAERAGLLAEIEQIKTGLAQADAGRNFGHAEIRAMLDALWRDMAERTGVLEIREALREMIDRVELEPEATTVRIVYRIPVASTDAETTGVSLASPRQADTTPVAEWVSEGTLDRKWKVYAARK